MFWETIVMHKEQAAEDRRMLANGKERAWKLRGKIGLEVSRQVMVSVLGWQKSRRWVGGGRNGWTAFPGLSCYLSRCENVYSQRLPLSQRWPAWLATRRGQWVRVSPGVGNHISLGLLPPLPPPCYLYLPTPRHTASSVTVRHACLGRAGSSLPCEN